ncbi:MAG TPA: rhamnulokinase family protein [Candidatus Acidoferrum sp.]|nr:rhamnulokinase family protein [Candidatus Acidoferrum sp.]
MPTHYLACDLGADSGRLMLGTLDRRKIVLEELHRFPNGPVKTDGALHWNLDGLFAELKTGLKKAAARRLPIAGFSTDSWGVDYVLYDEHGQIMPPVWHYRDARTAAGVESVKARADWPTIYAETGIQFMALNTIYQLAAEPSVRLAAARQLLLIGDAFNYFCSGVARNEVSLASTTQLYNPRTRNWSKKLLAALGLRKELFAPLCPSGTCLGPLKRELAAEVGLPQIEVIACCSHDTGSAVAAIPASGENWACLSSGTWSIMGVEWPQPVISDLGRDLGFTNEIGYGHSVRLLKNIVGLWLVQECRRHWAKGGTPYEFSMLEQMAADAPPFVSLINPNDPRFLSPDDMPEKIAAFCRETGQPVPADPAAFMRCIYESLALNYRVVLRRLEQLIGKKIERLHIVGGGSQAATLNQFTANALTLPVLAGPTECTALGNLLVQAITLGHLPSLAAAREVVRNSFTLKTVTPQDAAPWDAAAARFEKMLG